MNTGHFAELRQQIWAMATQPSLAPWQHRATHTVGGFNTVVCPMVGFAPNSDLLLVAASSGRDLFNCITGERVARDDSNLSWHNWGKLSAQGIGSLNGQTIRLAGIYGGGLNTITKDGWQLYAIAPTWPDYRVILCPPGASIYNNLAACVQIGRHDEIAAFGFSETGRSFIIVQNHTLSVYAREN